MQTFAVVPFTPSSSSSPSLISPNFSLFPFPSQKVCCSMYEETASFDANSIVDGPDGGVCLPPPPPDPFSAGNGNGGFQDNGVKLSGEEVSYNPDAEVQQLPLQNQADMAAFNAHLIQDSSNQEVLAFNSTPLPPDSSYAPTPDLLNLFNLPRCSISSSLLPNSSISFANPSHNFAGDLPVTDASPASSVVYDPLLYLNLPPQPPLIRDLFQSLPPNGFSLPGSRGSSLFGCGMEDVDRNGGGIYADGGGGDGEQQYDNGVLDFSWEMESMGKGRKGGKVTKHFATERQRRQQLNDKYEALKNLIPVRTKDDRASIVADAIGYIRELMTSVNDLKMLVEKKRCLRDRKKRLKTEEDSIGNGVDTSSIIKPLGDLDLQSFNNGSLRSSRLQRKSKDTEVDVRIVDDEVTIKLVQRKRINCLLSVSKVLNELQLDLHHVAGGHVGDYYSFLFNTKIYEGSSIYASAIANKVIEVVDTVYASTPSSAGCFYNMRELSVDGR